MLFHSLVESKLPSSLRLEHGLLRAIVLAVRPGSQAPKVELRETQHSKIRFQSPQPDAASENSGFANHD
jgi:hypothetical protein